MHPGVAGRPDTTEEKTGQALRKVDLLVDYRVPRWESATDNQRSDGMTQPATQPGKFTMAHAEGSCSVRVSGLARRPAPKKSPVR